MANAHRGEIVAELGGNTYTLCLTLGALAELESAFGAEDLTALAGRFETGALSARDLVKIIACGIRGGGNSMSDDEVAGMTVSEGVRGYVSIASQLLAVTFAGSQTEADTTRSPL